MSDTEVLIAGAGPTGLVLALWLTRQGVKVRIIDKTEANVSTSRALAVHARTLELYRQLDLADQVVADGHNIKMMNVWAEGNRKAQIPVGDIGTGLTPYPFIHIYRQDRHEKFLEERLSSLGVKVERNRELVDFTEHDSHVTARLRDTGEETSTANSGNSKNGDADSDADNVETCKASFILGCDGAHSAVRKTCGVGFGGGTYTHLFFVVDIEGSGPAINGEFHLNFSPSEFLLLFAYDKDRQARLVGAVDENLISKDLSDLTFEDVAPRILKTMKLQIEKVNWFTTYRVHHRMAGSFRKGRAFLVGDAAHIHSPAGGQGMNTGIGDAINLAWKLAAVLQGRANISLLDTYDVERGAFAKTLLRTTDRLFTAVVGKGYLSRFVRTIIVPYIAPILARFDFFRRRAFRGVSQIMINYRQSILSTGSAGYIRGGDRIPWAPVGELDNFDSLRTITWQVHVYGAATSELTEWCQSKNIPLHVFPWNKKYQEVGLGNGAAYLLRPDTYVAVAEPSGLPQNFDKYLEDIQLRLT